MLNIILKRAGIVTGPRRKHTSHSSLEVVKKDLLGMPQLFGGEEFLNFGSALHEVFLLQNFGDAFATLSKKDKELILAMTKKLNSHPVVISLMRDAIKEKQFTVMMNKVRITCILDAKQPLLKRGFDLKSTSCTTQKDFEEKMRNLGYIRQGLTYKLAAGLKQFYFVGINKLPPHSIFIVDIDGKIFKDDYKYAESELKFLLYFYKNYGKTISKP